MLPFLSAFFLCRLIYGFITKEECNAALIGQEVGTFMIRFSESSPGTRARNVCVICACALCVTFVRSLMCAFVRAFVDGRCACVC